MLLASFDAQGAVASSGGVGKMVFLLFNGGRLGWRTRLTEEVTMPAIVEFPQIVVEASPDFADLFSCEPQRRHFAEIAKRQY